MENLIGIININLVIFDPKNVLNRSQVMVFI